MDKPAIVRAFCEQRVGCPYIYGGTGKPCTPEYRTGINDNIHPNATGYNKMALAILSQINAWQNT